MYSGGGPAPPGQPQGYTVPPKVRYDALGESWRLLQPNLGVWVPATLLYLLIMGTILGGVYFVMYLLGLFGAALGGGERDFGSRIVANIVAQAISAAAFGLLGSFFTAGYYRMALKQVRGETPAIGDLFSGGDVYPQMIVGTLLVGLLSGIGTQLCYIPGILMAALWLLVNPIIVDKKVGGVEAMRMSWNALRGDLLNAVLFSIVLGLAVGAGALLCLVGLLITAPLYPLAISIVYRDFFDGTMPQGPTLDMPLPPPSAYQPGQYPPPPPPPSTPQG